MFTKTVAFVLFGVLAMGYFDHVQSGPNGLNELIRTMRADASRRSGVDEQALKVATAEEVTWSDGSLGCPSPGQSYTQALVPGYRVRIEAGGKLYDYHASKRGSWLLCPPGRAIDAAGPLRL